MLARIALGGVDIAGLTIRNLDNQINKRLHIRVASLDRSMESEIHAILTVAEREPGEPNDLLDTLMNRLSDIGEVSTSVCQI